MTVNVHTIIVHDSSIIKSALVPIRQLLEEAQKAKINILKNTNNNERNSSQHYIGSIK